MPRKKKYNKSGTGLFCTGCMCSDDDLLPGKPMMFMGQFMPCAFCIRNPDVQDRLAHHEPLLFTEFPDGTKPHALPLDCYMTQDMFDHYEIKEAAAIEDATQQSLRDAVAHVAKEYGVDLPPHEVDI